MNNIIKKLENEESKIQCTNCRRVIDFTENDEYVCKYGTTSVYYTTRPKCKYFKRHPKYITYNGMSKIRAAYEKDYNLETRYKQGKFKTYKVLK